MNKDYALPFWSFRTVKPEPVSIKIALIFTGMGRLIPIISFCWIFSLQDYEQHHFHRQLFVYPYSLAGLMKITNSLYSKKTALGDTLGQTTLIQLSVFICGWCTLDSVTLFLRPTLTEADKSTLVRKIYPSDMVAEHIFSHSSQSRATSLPTLLSLA